jgi:hypothetical protein
VTVTGCCCCAGAHAAVIATSNRETFRVIGSDWIELMMPVEGLFIRHEFRGRGCSNVQR